MNRIIQPIAAVFIGLFLTVSASSCVGGSDYSFHGIRKQIRELDSQLLQIQKTPPPSIAQSPYGPGNYERFIEVNSRKRRYEIHVPQGYSIDKQWPIVINYHGGGGRAAAARIQSGMDVKSDQAGFIAIYPDGTGIFNKRLLTWNAGACCSYAVEHNIDDVDFTRALLDDVVKLFNIDQRRIYATGLSNGAFMAYRIACELSDRVAAISAIAGVMTVDECRPKRPVPIIHFHGTLDKYSPYNGGVGENSISKVDYRSVDQTINEWLQLNHIPSKPAKVEKKSHATITTHANREGTEIVVVTLEDMGHTWPGGTRLVPKRLSGHLSQEIIANDLMWDFFTRHPLPTPGSKTSR